MGLEKVGMAYASKRMRETVPPGWNDVAYKGLNDCMAEAARLSTTKIKVRKEASSAATGSPNVAMQYENGKVSYDTSCFGEWRFWLFWLFSEDCCIKGTEVGTMMMIYDHAFEPFSKCPSTSCCAEAQGQATPCAGMKDLLAKAPTTRAGPPPTVPQVVRGRRQVQPDQRILAEAYKRRDHLCADLNDGKSNSLTTLQLFLLTLSWCFER